MQTVFRYIKGIYEGDVPFTSATAYFCYFVFVL